jgi:hypothetical protein
MKFGNDFDADHRIEASLVRERCEDLRMLEADLRSESGVWVSIRHRAPKIFSDMLTIDLKRAPAHLLRAESWPRTRIQH